MGVLRPYLEVSLDRLNSSSQKGRFGLLPQCPGQVENEVTRDEGTGVRPIIKVKSDSFAELLYEHLDVCAHVEIAQLLFYVESQKF